MKFRHPASSKAKLPALYIFAVILVLVIMGLLRNCSAPDTLPHFKQGFSEGDTLDVAVVYAPGSYALSGDTLSGENYRLLSQLKDSLHWRLRLWPVVSAREALEALSAGQYDIVASLPSDHELKSKFLTTDEVYLDRLVLIQRSNPSDGEPVKSALDLARDTIHVEKDSPAKRRIINLSHEIGDTIFIAEEESIGEEYLVMKTAAGQWRFAVVNEQTAKKMKESRYPELNIDTPVAFTQFQVWVLRPTDTLLKQHLDSALRVIRHL